MNRYTNYRRLTIGFAAACGILLSAGSAEANPPAGFKITCNNNCNNSGWVKDVRGTQEYEQRNNAGSLICRTKVFFRVGRVESSPGVFKNKVITRYWNYGTNSWNYNRQLSATDNDNNNEEKWDASAQDPGEANFRVRHDCDVVAHKRIVKGLRDKWGDLPPSNCYYEDCWEPPELASWKEYAIDTFRAIKDADIGRAFKSAAGDAVCYPDAEDDDNRRCVISNESDE